MLESFRIKTLIIKKKLIFTGFVFVLILVMGGAVYFIKYNERVVSYTVPRQIRYGFTVQNTTNRLINNAGLFVYAPVKQTGSQLCSAIEASHPYTMEIDALGNQVLKFTFEKLPPYATRIINIKAEVMLSEEPNRLPGAKKDRAAFLKPEKYVESDQPAVIKKAQALKKKKTVDTAESINNFVAGHIQQVGYIRNERGALYALSRKKGDCTENMDLFTALCRATGIPCRRVGGYICRNNCLLSAGGFHNWAEFYDKDRWFLADPQQRVFMQKPDDYIAFRIISDTSENSMQHYNRFRVQGKGVTVKMNS